MSYPVNDNQYEEVKIKSVEKSSFTRQDGWSFFVPEDSPVQPNVEMVARFYGKGIGYTVRGLFLGGKKVFYKTERQQKIDFDKSIEDDKIKKQQELDKNKPKLDERYNKLPNVFQKRLNKFRNANPNFRRDYEPYELFCCEQAIIFATHFKTTEALMRWEKLSWEQQKEELPKLSNDHSGNTFGMSCRLAHWYLSKPEMVIKEHGALTTLVGCNEYGCPHKEDK